MTTPTNQNSSTSEPNDLGYLVVEPERDEGCDYTITTKEPPPRQVTFDWDKDNNLISCGTFEDPTYRYRWGGYPGAFRIGLCRHRHNEHINLQLLDDFEYPVTLMEIGLPSEDGLLVWAFWDRVETIGWSNDGEITYYDAPDPSVPLTSDVVISGAAHGFDSTVRFPKSGTPMLIVTTPEQRIVLDRDSARGTSRSGSSYNLTAKDGKHERLILRPFADLAIDIRFHDDGDTVEWNDQHGHHHFDPRSDRSGG